MTLSVHKKRTKRKANGKKTDLLAKWLCTLKCIKETALTNSEAQSKFRQSEITE